MSSSDGVVVVRSRFFVGVAIGDPASEFDDVNLPLPSLVLCVFFPPLLPFGVDIDVVLGCVVGIFCTKVY